MSDISDALSRVHKAAKHQIVWTDDVTRADRELLLRAQWLQPIVRGWYLLVRPDVKTGESSPWYACFWDFLSLYLQKNYESKYCLSAENSLDLHVQTPTIPKQVIVMAERGNRSPLELPFETSLLVYSDPANLPSESIEIRGLRAMSLPLALCRVGPTYYLKNAREAEIALRLVRDPSEFTRVLLAHGYKRAANRIVGAYTFLQEDEMAASIERELKAAGWVIYPENPFREEEPLLSTSLQSPHAARIFTLWKSYRQAVIDLFPPEPGISNRKAYISQIDELYEQDAYNSLSIEGYRVDEKLIERVKNHGWDPDHNPSDRQTRDALAARGYYEAFQAVKLSIDNIFTKKKPGEQVEKDSSSWYRALFAPSARAGIMKEIDLIGYRRHQVYIRGSRHVPFPREALLDSMRAFYQCLKEEPHAAVRAVLGHFLFVYIHPYPDGNGRTARFLMNAMFASGGYPWTVIRVKHKAEYFAALESASVDSDIKPLTQFILNEMQKS